METSNLIVNVEVMEKDVGALLWDKDKGVASFQYEDRFLRRGLDIAPIIMPLRDATGEQVYQFLNNRNACFNGLTD